jgi:hypothetical protein
MQLVHRLPSSPQKELVSPVSQPKAAEQHPASHVTALQGPASTAGQHAPPQQVNPGSQQRVSQGVDPAGQTGAGLQQPLSQQSGPAQQTPAQQMSLPGHSVVLRQVITGGVSLSMPAPSASRPDLAASTGGPASAAWLGFEDEQPETALAERIAAERSDATSALTGLLMTAEGED